MSTTVKYETRPLKTWNKAKELRLNHYKDVVTAHQNGKLVVTGGTEGFMGLAAGLGPFVYLGAEPYGATIGADPVFSQKCVEEMERRNYARDLCAYLRNYLGSMFLDQSPFGTPFPRPDFSLQLHVCDSHAKWMQIITEHYGVPYYAIEWPVIVREDKASLKRAQDYMVAQLHEAIEWMEKITGRKYDDEKLISALRNEFKAVSLWAEIACLNQAVPAPLDYKSMLSLYVISVLIRHEDEAIQFYKELLDEVKDRVKHKIAALGTERIRLIDDSQPPWHSLDIYRFLEEYGAVVVGSHYMLVLAGNFLKDKNGDWVPAPTPEERGMPMRTRDDALRALAVWYMERPARECFGLPAPRSESLLRIAKQWKVNAILMHLNRGCEGTGENTMENRLALINAGYPVLTYEGNMADKREFDEGEVLQRMTAFMESLDLKKLPKS